MDIPAVVDRPLNVLQLLPALEAGGVERGTLEVASELVRLGHRSVVVSAGGRLVQKLQDEGSEHIGWEIGRKSIATLRYVHKLRAWLNTQSIDIIHARSRLPAWIAWLAWRGMNPMTRPRFVTSVHGLYSVNPYSAIMTRGERVIAVSEAVKSYLLDRYTGMDPTRISVIPRGVDTRIYVHGFSPSAEWQASWQEQYPQFMRQTLITLPGRITRLKGHADFIDLIARLHRSGQRVHGLVVGNEEARHRGYVRELRARITRNGVENHVHFIGHREDLREIFSVSRLVLTLSNKPEAFGRTVLEALALGKPVVGYSHGGVAELLRAACPGGMITPGNIDMLVQQVMAMLRSGSPLVSSPISSDYVLSTMLRRTLELYSMLVDTSLTAH